MKSSGYLIIGFKKYFAYKGQVLAQLMTSPIGIIVMIIVWSSIFNYSGLSVIGGFTLQEMINYYIIIFIAGIIIADRSDMRLGDNIKHGYLAMRLTLPLAIYRLYFDDSMGEKLGELLTQLLPALLIGYLFVGFTATSVVNTLLFAVSCGLAILMLFFFNMTFGLLYFKLKEFRYISRIKTTIIDFFSGKFLPLSIFPMGLLSVVKFLPFNYFLYEPANIFLGKYS
ncbi:MAG: ABC-2 family transporter protein, partial [Candidatus Nanoarchaeia archaeon]